MGIAYIPEQEVQVPAWIYIFLGFSPRVRHVVVGTGRPGGG